MKKTAATLALAAALAASAGAASAADVKPILLKTPIAFATKLPGLGSTIKWVGDRITTVSNGSVKMKVYEPGKLVAPFEILDAVSSGKVNSGYATAGYWTGKIPAAPLFSAVPFGPEAGEYMAWLLHGNGMKLYQEMYDEAGYHVKVVLCGIIAPETSGWFAQEITSADDLKGLKLRFFGLGGQVMQRLGVSTSLLPGGEIFPALEKKAIDGSEFSMPAIDKLLGFYKLVKHNYFPGWHQQATVFELLVNKETWDGLHESQQLVIETTCLAATANSFAEGEAIQFDVLRENVEEQGVQLHYWSDDMLALFQETWNQIAAEQAADDEFFNKVWTDLSEFRSGYNLWEANAFLPRARR